MERTSWFRWSRSLLAVFVLLTAVAYTRLLERKVVAHMQNRWGPSRVGPFGIWQPLADGLKFIFKEDLTPPYVNKPLYMLAPVIALTTALTSIAVIPVGPWIKLGSIHTPLQITDVNIGLLIILGSPRSACTAWRWQDGRRTASIPCWAACAPRRRWSATKSRSACRWSAC